MRAPEGRQIERHCIGCDAVRNGWIQAAYSARSLAVVEARARALQRWGAKVDFLARGDMEAATGSRFHPGGMIERDAAKPEVFGAATTQLSAGGLRLTAQVLGAGASGAHVVVQADAALFVGDLVNPDNHAWLELGQIDEWLARLDELQRLAAARIYPGRGQAGGPELIARQMAYLRDVQQRVQAALPEGEISWFTKRRLAQAIASAHPSLGYEGFMRDGLDAVWRVEAAKLAKDRRTQ